MAGENDRYTERLREKAQRFALRGRVGTYAQEQLKELDKQNTRPVVQSKKDKKVEEEQDYDSTV
jgi:hypothetical protein